MGHDTTANFTKDVLGQTLTRFVEITAKPRLTRPMYCELLKHPHKAALKAFRTAPASRLAASTSGEGSALTPLLGLCLHANES